MANIVEMLVDAMVTAIAATDVDYCYRGPIAEHRDSTEGYSVAIVYVNDPDDIEWRHELQGRDSGFRMVGEGNISHRPWARRFTVTLSRIYAGSSRSLAVEDFSDLMRKIEAVFFGWTTTVGPDDRGESMNRACETTVKSRERYTGGETEFVVEGKLWVEFYTS